MKRSFVIPSSLLIAGQKIRIRVRNFEGELFGQFHFDKKIIDIDVKVAANKKLFIEYATQVVTSFSTEPLF